MSTPTAGGIPLPTLKQYALHASYANVLSSLTLILYDWILTLELELKYIWSPQSLWNLGKLLYIITRYLALVDIPVFLTRQIGYGLSVETCVQYYNWTAWSFMVGTCVADLILAIRTWIIWERFHFWLAGLALVWTATWVITFVALGRVMPTLIFTPIPDPALSRCFLAGASDGLYIGYVVMTVYDTLIFGARFIKGIDYYRTGSSANLSTVLYRDGLMFSLILALFSVLNMVVLLTTTADLFNLLLAMQRAIHSVLTSRILLHLRRAAGERQAFESTIGMDYSEIGGVVMNLHSLTPAH
ncbi:hypothetical protein DACRYDRAFT_100945 [Dacryopinax primogenitus]|uniref:DUF6533 domain-containing protein n=1 Tax=Dacryopinax primogenitus (strain DJM 731) TaxID=1858805 RepID=M5G9G0_DACPD|nr:uncharacterized protein DACRYDRAFT_100945 [Dacryopinax primogenitus]EJU00433.1 hypothetical protein DACRYDRAFT_100945 [Dacryopinax primogenitus]